VFGLDNSTVHCLGVQFFRGHSVEMIGDFPEQVWCKISVGSGYDLLIGVCYRTPTEQVFGKDIHSKLRDMLLEVSNKNFILMGDFNYWHIDWIIGACETGAMEECRLFLECLQEGFITQHVTSRTTEISILDLVLTNEPELINEVENLGKFATSDHSLLFWKINVGREETSSKVIRFDYRKMDLSGIREELRSSNWDEEMKGNVNESWALFKRRLLDLQQKYVPKARVQGGKRRKEVWLTHKAVKTIKRKYKVYRKYRDSKHPACIRADKKAHREIRRAKYNFERKLADNIKKDTKSFYTYVRSKAKAKIKVGLLVNKDGEVISLAEDMSEEFNKFFISVFTNQGNESIPEAEWMYKGPTDEQLHFCILLVNPTVDLELECISEKPMKRRFQRYIVRTEIFSTFHARVEYISFLN